MYDCISNKEERLGKSDLEQNYICTECGPTYLASIKADKKSHSQTDAAGTSKNETTDKPNFPTQPTCITFPFSDLFSGSDYTSSKRNVTLQNYEVISNMFISLSKTEFAPWEVYLQHGKTGVMLHFYFKSSSHTLPTKTLRIFCPFMFGAPYQISFSVYALGKQLDNGFLPNDFFENEIRATNTISDLLDTLFSLQLCLGIYDEKSLKTIKRRQLSDTFDTNSTKTYEIDSKYLLTNRYGKQIGETIRSVHPLRPCERLLFQPHAERCQNCTFLVQNTNSFHEHQIPSDKCHSDSHTALTKLSFEQLLERYKHLKKSCDYWKSRTRFYMNRKKIKPPVNFNISSTNLGTLVDTAVEENLLKENSVLYMLILDAVIGLQKQEKEFTKSNGKLTKNNKKPRAKWKEISPFGYQVVLFFSKQM